MEIDLELSLCEQDKLDNRSDKDVNILDVKDGINVEECEPEKLGGRSDRDVKIVDVGDEINVEECAQETLDNRLDKGVDIVDGGDEINVDECAQEKLDNQLDKGVDIVDGGDEIKVGECEQEKLDNRSDKDVNDVDVGDEINAQECEQEKLRNRSYKDVDIVDGGDEINVEECEQEKLDKKSDKDVNIGDDEDEIKECEQEKLENMSHNDVNIVKDTDEINVEEHVSSPRTSEHVKKAHGFNADQSVSSCQDQDDVNRVEVSAVEVKGVVREPQNGLEFESKEEAYSYYREYARSVGFGITIKASRRSKKSGKFIDIKIACSRFGSKRESATTVNPRLCITKTDCKACLHMKRRENEKWVIHSFVKEHNHEICPDDCIYAISGRNKKLATVPCQNKGLKLALDEEDVKVMFDHFMCMQDEDPNFFYATDFDHEKRLKSVLWVDAKCKRDYSSFCDAVFFDTYYVRSNYKIPFVPVVGVNHHFQYILLGCALIGEETTSAFVWLMRTWLKAVGGQAPRLVITDQDKYLKEAVADVFTDAYHCFCLWHVLSRIPENVGCFINENEMFMAKFNKCIYRSWTVEQFEKKWSKLVDKFDLKEVELLHLLYEDREKWAPTYMQDSFLAGISTKERSGSITSFFDRYISQEATFKDFIEQYKAFWKVSYDMEANDAVRTQDKQLGLRSLSPFEKQMSTIYTHAVFRRFQVEVLGVASCRLQKEGEHEATVIFQVDDLEDHQKFTVAWNESESKVRCLCHSFEYRGFLCRHAILVLQESGVSKIPSHYILKRWTKDAKVRHTVGDGSKRLNYRVQRFNDLCKLAVKLGEEGSLSPETYHIAFQALEAALKHCVDVNNSVRSISVPNMSANHGLNNIGELNPSSSVPYKKRKRSRKRKGQTEPDDITAKSQASCQKMEQMKSRAHNLDSSYIPQQELAGELGSRSRGLDSYYGAQQSVQAIGQLTPVSTICAVYYGNRQATQGQLPSLPTRAGHYGPQQNMQGMGQFGFRPIVNSSFGIQDNLRDMERSVGSSQFHGNASKHPADKHLSK